jgi:polygalacturonase
MSGGVRNVLAENLTADGTDAGVRIKTRRGRGATIENVLYRNMTLKNNNKQAITIDMFYDVGNNPNVDQSGPDGIPVIRNVTVEGLTCDNADTALVIRGLPDSPITGVTLQHIRISAKKGTTVSDVRNLTSGTITVSVVGK